MNPCLPCRLPACPCCSKLRAWPELKLLQVHSSLHQLDLRSPFIPPQNHHHHGTRYDSFLSHFPPASISLTPLQQRNSRRRNRPTTPSRPSSSRPAHQSACWFRHGTRTCTCTRLSMAPRRRIWSGPLSTARPCWTSASARMRTRPTPRGWTARSRGLFRLRRVRRHRERSADIPVQQDRSRDRRTNRCQPALRARPLCRLQPRTLSAPPQPTQRHTH